MVHISKKHSNDNVFNDIFEQFLELFIATGSKGEVRALFNEVLGDEERIMLAKRSIALLLLLEGFSTYKVADVVGLGTSTTKRLREQLKRRDTPYLTTFLANKKRRKVFWETLEILARAGLPPQGKGRLKWLYRHFDSKQ